MTRREEAKARVALSLLGEPGDGELGALVQAHGPTDTVALIQRQVAPGGFALKQWEAAMARWSPRLSVLTSNDQAERARRAGAHLVIPGDDEWPHPLEDLGPHAPQLLWVKGDTSLLRSRQSIAIVGARAATGYGEHVAADLAGALARTGATVISGGAYGIDGVAHRAALGVEGNTLAVMAGGVDRPYPAGHASLISQIARSCAVISEMPLGVTPSRWRFLARNRVIAALADATVVVEAGWRSGSLNTAGHAAALGRPLGAVPGPVTSPASAGCHRLLRDYNAECITTPDDARALAGWALPGAQPAEAGDESGSSSARVVDALSFRVARNVDDVARRVGISVGEVQAALGILLLEGRAHRDEEGNYLLSRRS